MNHTPIPLDDANVDDLTRLVAFLWSQAGDAVCDELISAGWGCTRDAGTEVGHSMVRWITECLAADLGLQVDWDFVENSQ